MLWRQGLAVVKDPDSVEPRGYDWTKYLAELGPDVTITTSDWVALPSGLTLSSKSIVNGGLKTQVRYAGGVDGLDYTLTNFIICSDGTEDDRSIIVKVRQR